MDSERELAGEAVILGQGFDLVPGRVLDLDAVRAAVLLAPVLDLAGVKDAARSLGGRRFLQVFDEVADVLLELGERAERIDLEAGHEAAVIMAARRLDPAAEARQQTPHEPHPDAPA